MKVVKNVITEDDVVAEKIIHICPVCGKEMDETYMGRDYCADCAAKLEGKFNGGSDK